MKSSYWTEKHTRYKKEDWIKIPSIFAEHVVAYLPKSGTLLELGAGHGQDSMYFAKQGYTVTSTDLEVTALSDTLDTSNITVKSVDIAQPLPYGDETFDIVYAHLSLHYFDQQTTIKMFDEIWRVLTPNGILAFLVNSTSDPEYGVGEEVSTDCFMVEGQLKHYFTAQTTQSYAAKFVPILCDNEGETYKDIAKGVHGLIRYIGRKAAK